MSGFTVGRTSATLAPSASTELQFKPVAEKELAILETQFAMLYTSNQEVVLQSQQAMEVAQRVIAQGQLNRASLCQEVQTLGCALTESLTSHRTYVITVSAFANASHHVIFVSKERTIRSLLQS